MNNNNSSIQKSISLLMAGNIAYKSFISGCEWIIERSKSIGEDWQLKASKVGKDHIRMISSYSTLNFLLRSPNRGYTELCLLENASVVY